MTGEEKPENIGILDERWRKVAKGIMKIVAKQTTDPDVKRLAEDVFNEMEAEDARPADEI